MRVVYGEAVLISMANHGSGPSAKQHKIKVVRRSSGTCYTGQAAAIASHEFVFCLEVKKERVKWPSVRNAALRWARWMFGVPPATMILPRQRKPRRSASVAGISPARGR